MSIRDDFWLWGQVPNSHHEEGNNIYNLPGVNKMTPIEGAKFFGIKNICMVVMEDKPAVEEFPQMADELSSIDKVATAEAILRQCLRLPKATQISSRAWRMTL